MSPHACLGRSRVFFTGSGEIGPARSEDLGENEIRGRNPSCGRHRYLLSLLFVVGTIVSGGCGYTLVGRSSTLPASIRVIQFASLANQTTRVGVEQRLSREIARELATRGRFSVQAGAAGADAELSGSVTGFDLYPINFDESGRARQYQVRITARVALKGISDERVIWENPAYTFRDSYDLGTSAAGYIDREDEAINRVAGRFAESLVSTILEGF